jgi:hypothetical protein
MYVLCAALTAMQLDSSFGHLPLVTVSGRVRSDTPLTGQQSGLQAAIVEQHVITDHDLGVMFVSLLLLSALAHAVTCVPFVGNTTLLEEDTKEEGW